MRGGRTLRRTLRLCALPSVKAARVVPFYLGAAAAAAASTHAPACIATATTHAVRRYFSAYWYYNKRYRIYSHFGPLGAESFNAMATSEVTAFRACRNTRTARRCARSLFTAAEQLVKGL